MRYGLDSSQVGATDRSPQVLAPSSIALPLTFCILRFLDLDLYGVRAPSPDRVKVSRESYAARDT